MMAALFHINKTNPDDAKRLSVAVGKVMGEMYGRLLEPLFKEHPDLIPKELGSPPTKMKKSRKRVAKSK